MPASRLAPLLALLVAGAAAAQPSWELLDDSPYHRYRTEDLWFVDPDHGWGVDGDGRVHRTTDGGDSWQQTTQLAPYLRSTAFVSPMKGWVGSIHAVGIGERLFETTDGGLSFTDISARIDGGTHGICSLFAVDAQTVYGAGTYDGPAVLIKTTDGGASWTRIPLAPYLDTAIDVHFFDADHGLVTGGIGRFGDATRPRIIATDDGGQTWTIRHTLDVSPAWGWKMSFPTPEIGYAAVEKYDGDVDSIVLKTVDGGATWTELSLPNAGGNMQGIGFITPEVGWVSGRGTTSRTLDGGQTWTQVELGGELDTNVNRFVFLDDGLGFASGHRIYRIDARLASAGPGPDDSGLWSVGPNPARDVVRVRYRPTAPAPATIEITDLLGRRVGVVEDAAGDGVVSWAVPAGLAPGVYTVRLGTAAGAWAQTVVIGR